LEEETTQITVFWVVGFGIQFGCHWNCEKEEEEEEAEELWGLNFIEFFSHWVWILCMSGKEGGGFQKQSTKEAMHYMWG
jgi:hypothetical protein